MKMLLKYTATATSAEITILILFRHTKIIFNKDAFLINAHDGFLLYQEYCRAISHTNNAREIDV